MKRAVLILLLLAIPAYAAEIKFKDLPKKHWAESSVYDLVRMGVTTGYPDGTFRGNNNMTRYEMAVFLSKLGDKVEDNVRINKLLAELKNEFATVKYQYENPEHLKIRGGFEEQTRISNLLLNSDGPHGPRLDYRIKVTGEKSFGKYRGIKINLDTMDAGYNNGGARDFATKLLDIEGRMRINNVDVKVVAGPGTVVHTETDGTIPSDDYYIYIRPKSSVHLSTALNGLDLTLNNVTRQVRLFGTVGVSEFYATAAYTYKSLPLLGKTKVTFLPRYLFTNTERDVRAELHIDSSPMQNLSGQLLFGAGHMANHHGLYVKGTLGIKTERNELSVIVHKVGSDYRASFDKYEFVYLNNFEKLVVDGTTDAGLKFIHRIDKDLSLKYIADMAMNSEFKYGANYPGTSLTQQIDIGSENFVLFYRSYLVPSGISSADPTMARTVAIGSDFFGFKFKYGI